MFVKALARARARGIKELLGVAAGRIAEAISSDEVLVFLMRETSRAAEARGDLESRAATETDGERYARDIGTDSARTFRARLTDATSCFIVLSAGRIVHATWATTGMAWTRELRRFFRPPPGDAYVYESFTREEVRGRGAYPFALEQIAAHMAGRGIRRVWVAVEKSNHPSLRAVSKADFRPMVEVEYGRRLGRLRLGEPTGPAAEDLVGCLVASRRTNPF